LTTGSHDFGVSHLSPTSLKLPQFLGVSQAGGVSQDGGT